MGRLIKLKQQSEPWLKWRHQGLGSSDISAILGLSPWKTRRDVLVEKSSSEFKSITPNAAMKRGILLEPIARELYERKTYLIMDPVCMIHDDIEYLIASLDGWNSQHKIVVEIKAPNKHDHQNAKQGFVPEKYLPQLQHQMLVSGAKEAHYVSYNDGMAYGRKIGQASHHIVYVKQDVMMQNRIYEMTKTFNEELIQAKSKILADPQYQIPEDPPPPPSKPRVVRCV